MYVSICSALIALSGSTCYRNGVFRYDGEGFHDDCNPCTCRNGSVTCTKVWCFGSYLILIYWFNIWLFIWYNVAMFSFRYVLYQVLHEDGHTMDFLCLFTTHISCYNIMTQSRLFCNSGVHLRHRECSQVTRFQLFVHVIELKSYIYHHYTPSFSKTNKRVHCVDPFEERIHLLKH